MQSLRNREPGSEDGGQECWLIRIYYELSYVMGFVKSNPVENGFLCLFW